MGSDELDVISSMNLICIFWVLSQKNETTAGWKLVGKKAGHDTGRLLVYEEGKLPFRCMLSARVYFQMFSVFNLTTKKFQTRGLVQLTRIGFEHVRSTDFLVFSIRE
jgi:hypothetical protein